MGSEKVTYRTLNAAELLDFPFQPRETVLEPWLCTQSLNLVHAWRGVGKTHFSLGVAYAIASGGSFLKWKAPKARPVLYIDGEMPGEVLKERLSRMAQDAEKDIAEPELLRFLTPDAQPGPVPNLSSAESQAALEPLLGNAQLIIIDNLSCLAGGSESENDAESWSPISTWALKMRKQGRSVLFVHHSGKSGHQRGTSKKEDILDTVLNLKRPADYEPSQGACFEIQFEKARSLAGEETKPFEARLCEIEGRQTWTMQDLEDSTFERVIALAKLKLTGKKIAEELHVHESTVCRHLQSARAQGLLKGGNDDTGWGR